MERLTTKNIAGVAVYKHPFECERCGETIWRLSDYGDGSPTEKLADYEDAEEQGLLLRLPCKVGDTVFKLKKHNYCPVGICRKDISCSECRANTPFGIAEGKFMLKELKEIGKTVFLTQAEAEQKLKEMESECHEND